MCGYLPSQIKDQCTAFVDQYADDVVKLIAQGLSPDQVCSAVGLCSSSKKTPWGAFVKILPEKQKGVVFFSIFTSSNNLSVLTKKVKLLRSLDCQFK